MRCPGHLGCAHSAHHLQRVLFTNTPHRGFGKPSCALSRSWVLRPRRSPPPAGVVHTKRPVGAPSNYLTLSRAPRLRPQCSPLCRVLFTHTPRRIGFMKPPRAVIAHQGCAHSAYPLQRVLFTHTPRRGFIRNCRRQQGYAEQGLPGSYFYETVSLETVRRHQKRHADIENRRCEEQIGAAARAAPSRLTTSPFAAPF